MTRPLITIHNSETDEIITREMNDEEFAQYTTEQAQFQADAKAKADAAESLAALKASAKAKLIAGQPLTPEEANTLVI